MSDSVRQKTRRCVFAVAAVALAAVAFYFTAVLIYKGSLERKYPASLINRKSTVLCDRFLLPEGCERDVFAEGGTEYALRHQKLKPFGTAAYKKNGLRAEGAGLWAVPDGITAAETDAAIVGNTAPSTEIGASNAVPGNYIVLRDGGRTAVYLIMDTCKNGSGERFAILMRLTDGDPYAAGASAELRDGCWTLLGDGVMSAEGVSAKPEYLPALPASGAENRSSFRGPSQRRTGRFLSPAGNPKAFGMTNPQGEDGFYPVAGTNVFISSTDGFSQSGEMIIPTVKSTLNIRSGPGFSYPVILTVSRISALKVSARGIWYYVECDGIRGYVYGSSFDAKAAYEAGRLEGLRIGIDPDGQVALDSDLEAIALGSSAMSPKMNERYVGRGTEMTDYMINFSVASALSRLLTLEGADVIMSKSDVESNLSNSARARLLNGSDGSGGCDLILRISCNHSDNTAQRGGMALIRFGSAEEHYALAKELLMNISAASGIPAYGVRYTSDNTFLNWCADPAVSLEIGYLSNVSDEKIIADGPYQDLICGAIRDTLVGLYEKVDEAAAAGD